MGDFEVGVGGTAGEFDAAAYIPGAGIVFTGCRTIGG
jgi:hypothetical protein